MRGDRSLRIATLGTEVPKFHFDAECPTGIRCGPESRTRPGGGLGTEIWSQVYGIHRCKGDGRWLKSKARWYLKS